MNEARKKWASESALSKILITFSFAIVIFAYLPTLQFDYVTQDQWRAFRYSTPANTPFYRAKACIIMLSNFYPKTGRPLVWIPECLEHTTVSKISDFFYLRPFVLLIVLTTVGCLGWLLTPFFNKWWLGTATAATFVMAPGYSFMYLQGMTAGAVLFCIVLSIFSFSSLRKWLNSLESLSLNKNFFKGLYIPFIFFMLGLMIYPVWAFIVVSLSFLTFCLDHGKSLKKRIWDLGISLSFYAFASIIYYAIVRILWTKSDDNLKDYTVSMQLNPHTLFDRACQALKYFFSMSPLNFPVVNGITIGIFFIFLTIIAWQLSEEKNNRIVFFLTYSVVMYFLGLIFIPASISPWLFSQFPNIATRHLIPWYLFLCVASIWIIFFILTHLFSPRVRNRVLTSALISILVFIGVRQNSLSFLETVTSGIEIDYLRVNVDSWLKKNKRNHLLLIILPSESRLPYIERLSKKMQFGENAVLSSSQNPVSIPWMLNAILREKTNIFLSHEILVDCGFDIKCANTNVHNGNYALTYTYGGKVLTDSPPFIINMSLLTNNPARFHIEYNAPLNLDSAMK